MRIKHVPVSEIIVGERMRKEYKDIPALAESLKEKGFIQPLVIDSNLRLIVGGRRLQAAEVAGLDKVPCVNQGDVDDITLRELELEENIMRADLEWWEADAAIAEIDRLKRLKHGDPVEDRTRGSGWSVAKTAELLGKSIGGVQEARSMAEAVEHIPELKECKTRAEAKKKFRSICEMAAVKVLTERAKEESVHVEYANRHYLLGNAIDGMKSLDQTVAVFADVDPPYAVNFQQLRERKKKEGGKTVKSYNEVLEDDYPDFLADTAEEVYRVLSNHAWVIWWFATKHYSLVLDTLELAGFKVDAVPCVWYKEGGPPGATMQPEILLPRVYETFFVARKGTPVLQKRGRPNVFAFKPVNTPIHPTEKPIELMLELLEIFMVPGRGIALVPFLGSGVTLRALYQTKRTGFGWDLSEGYKQAFLGKVLADKEEGLYEWEAAG